MKVTVELDENGMLPDAYGKYASAADKDGHHASKRSFPFAVEEVPEGTRALAWILLDWDSVPVCGLPWIHWAAWLGSDSAGEDPFDGESLVSVDIPDNVSREGLDGLHEGFTSGKDARGVFGTGYEGPCPPDKDHIYTLYVAALDEEPVSVGANGEPFWANELVNAVRPHVIEIAKALLPSRA